MRNQAKTESSRTRWGFTLVELLVIVVILGIIAALVMPSVGRTEGVRVMSITRKITADLEYAQNTAITLGTPIRVEFSDPNANYYTLYNASTPLEHPITQSDYVVNCPNESGITNLQVSANFAGDPNVVFDELGAPVGLTSEGTITVSYGTYQYTIKVKPVTGKITVKASN